MGYMSPNSTAYRGILLDSDFAIYQPQINNLDSLGRLKQKI